MHSRLAAAIFGLGIVDVAYIDFILGPAVLAAAPRGEASQVGSTVAAPTLHTREQQGAAQPDSPAPTGTPPSLGDIAPEPSAPVAAAEPPRNELVVPGAPLPATDPLPEPTAEQPQAEALRAPATVDRRPAPIAVDQKPAPAPLDDVPPSAPTPDAAPVAEAEWTVLFPLAGRAGLPEGAQDIVSQIAERLRQDSRLRLRIVGHADERGTRAHNWQLGKQRARAIAHALQIAGVSPQQLEVQSEGEDEPAALGSMPEALARNRRAEMAIYAGRSQTP